MDDASWGIIGGMAGSILGVLGGVIGTWFSIRNTNGPEERAFMVRVSGVAWLAIGLFLVFLLLLPRPWNMLMWVPYGILLPLSIKYINRRQQEIRGQESRDES